MRKGRRQLHANSATRRIFGVLIVCWLNMAILPCAMALGDIEHCPPTDDRVVHAMAEHDGHQESNSQPDCDMVSSGCCDLDVTAFEGRSGAFKYSADECPAIAPIASWPVLNVVAASVHDAMPLRPDGHPTPLHVLNCVYLK